MMPMRIGTAGWGIPRASASSFPADGSTLQRYSACFDAVEINSTFYRSHRPATWARWRESTPEGFRFALKLPRDVTHISRLSDCWERLDLFLAEASQLGDKLGPLLIQLPPSLAFEAQPAEAFFAGLRNRTAHPAACEPRHPSWFEPGADALLDAHRVARVAADPARHPLADVPGGWRGIEYWRLHGSPRMYFSAYGEPALRKLAGRLLESPAEEVWCIFDNTALGAAAANALDLEAITEGPI